jgi:hypothetical protein
MRALSILFPIALAVVGAAACGSSGNQGGDADGGHAGSSSGGASSGGASSGGSSGGSSGASSSGASSSGASSSGAGDDGGDPPGDGGVTVVPPNPGDGGLVTYGSPYSGGLYHLGPVDYPETQWHNACAPQTKYDPRVQAVEGVLLAGLWDGITMGSDGTEAYCDSCIWVTTAKGKSSMLRVVTFGQSTTNSIDVSPQAFSILNVMENPRNMTWSFAKCPDTGPVQYEFQTGSSEYWTSLWVRNARVPLAKVEVQSPNHSTFTLLKLGFGNGARTDGGGFGKGKFTIRSTGIDGQVITDTFDWPSSGIAGAFLTGKGNFQ